MRLQPAEAIPFPADVRVREMLGHDVYDVPYLPDREEQVVCSYCGEAARALDQVPHQSWCVYRDGPVCPEVPN